MATTVHVLYARNILGLNRQDSENGGNSFALRMREAFYTNALGSRNKPPLEFMPYLVVGLSGLK